jgi:hypothetical protein
LALFGSPEQAIQRAVVQHLRWRSAPGLVFLHPANGGWRSATEAAIFKGLGVQAGAPDLLLWRAGKSYGLELKAPGGRTTAAQAELLTALERAGAVTAIAQGLDAALRKLEEWGLLRAGKGAA